MTLLLIALFGWMVYDIIADRGALSAGLALGCCSMPSAAWPNLPDPILWLAFFGALWFWCRSFIGGLELLIAWLNRRTDLKYRRRSDARTLAIPAEIALDLAFAKPDPGDMSFWCDGPGPILPNHTLVWDLLEKHALAEAAMLDIADEEAKRCPT